MNGIYLSVSTAIGKQRRDEELGEAKGGEDRFYFLAHMSRIGFR